MDETTNKPTCATCDVCGEDLDIRGGCESCGHELCVHGIQVFDCYECLAAGKALARANKARQDAADAATAAETARKAAAYDGPEPRECRHGSLRRKCEPCDVAEERDDALARVAELEASPLNVREAIANARRDPTCVGTIPTGAWTGLAFSNEDGGMAFVAVLTSIASARMAAGGVEWPLRSFIDSVVRQDVPREQAKHAEARAADLRLELERMRSTLERVEALYGESKARVAKLERERAAIQHRSAESEAERDAATERVEVLEKAHVVRAAEVQTWMRDAIDAQDERDAATERAETLTGMLVKLFGWSDTSFLHAVMHVENAVLNLRADLATEASMRQSAEARSETLAEALRRIAEGPHGCPKSPTVDDLFVVVGGIAMKARDALATSPPDLTQHPAYREGMKAGIEKALDIAEWSAQCERNRADQNKHHAEWEKVALRLESVASRIRALPEAK